MAASSSSDDVLRGTPSGTPVPSAGCCPPMFSPLTKSFRTPNCGPLSSFCMDGGNAVDAGVVVALAGVAGVGGVLGSPGAAAVAVPALATEGV